MSDSRDLADRLLVGRRSDSSRIRKGFPRHLRDHPEIRAIEELRALGASVGVDDRAFFQPLRKLSGGRAVAIDGVPALNFSSFDYLGLAEHSEVRQAAAGAVDVYGTSVSAARIVGGEIDLFEQLEAKIARFVDEEAALIFVSGYLTNLSFLGWALGPNDLVLHDELVHNSMITGARLSGARRLSFRHNDDEHLEELLAQHRSKAETCVVMIEGVYSMDGDIARIDPILEVARSYDADTFVDEAHSFGVIGATGRGIKEHAFLETSSDLLIMSSLSKALAGLGGFVATGSNLLEAARFTAPGAGLYCTAMTPSSAAACLTALGVLEAHPELVEELRRKSVMFTNLLRDAGVDIGLAEGTPVVPVLTGSSVAAMQLSNRLQDHGIIAHAIMYPAVPEHLARVRFFVSAAHTDEALRFAAGAVAECFSLGGYES